MTTVNRRIEYQVFPKYKNHKKMYVPHPGGLVSFWSIEYQFVGPFLATGELIERYYIHFN